MTRYPVNHCQVVNAYTLYLPPVSGNASDHHHMTHLEGVDVVCTELLSGLDLPDGADLLHVVAARHPAPHHVGATRVINPEQTK